ncbi:MAG: capsule biosynthesis protein [Halocynthiibacter sp.]
MTIKAKKFRIRRSAALLAAAVSGREHGTGRDSGNPPPRPGAQNADTDASPAPPRRLRGEVSSAAEVSAEQQIAEIRREGLTGRQLRMARRVAQRHGLAPTSDYDAIRLLRAKGIDPFRRSNLLELVVAEDQDARASDGVPSQLPQTVPRGGVQLPSIEVISEDDRVREIQKIQQDIVRRRRRKISLLFSRLAFFVFLPTLLAGYYYYAVATPLYATKSEFVIQQANSASSSGGLGGLFSGTQLATSQDSITVQSYLQSRDAMLRLDRDLGFKAHFSQSFIDPIQRLDEDSTNEAAYRVYSKQVKIAYDPTEGIIKMEVAAADPAVSAEFSTALITYAEDVVDNLSKRLRADQMRGASESFQEAEVKTREAQLRVIQLQEEYNVFSADVEVGLLTSRISALEMQLTQDQLTLEELLSNERPNPARVDPLKRRIASIVKTVADLRSQLTQGGTGDVSLARIGSELAVAQADLQLRNLMMQQSLQQLETARIEANRQTRYLSTGVTPIAPDEPTYPRKFENTLLAFLIFSGIYLMASLTATILREQVSS